jgi:hypothetical protein
MPTEEATPTINYPEEHEENQKSIKGARLPGIR